MNRSIDRNKWLAKKCHEIVQRTNEYPLEWINYRNARVIILFPDVGITLREKIRVRRCLSEAEWGGK